MQLAPLSEVLSGVGVDRVSVGCTESPFILHGATKPLLYTILADDIGCVRLHDHVSQMPTTSDCNSIRLDSHSESDHWKALGSASLLIGANVCAFALEYRDAP